MNLVDKNFLRSLLRIRGRVLALALIIAAGVGIFVGIQLALANLRATQDTLLDRMGVAEFEVQLLPEDSQNLPAFSGIAGVQAVESRLVIPGYINLEDGRPLNALLIFQESPTPKLNRLQLLQGRLFVPGAGEVVIDRGLAQYHRYGVGDRIKVQVGGKLVDRHIVGVVLSPEFLVTASNPEYVVAEPGSLGIVWTDPLELRDTLGFSMVNSLLFHTVPGTGKAPAREAIAGAVRRLNVERIVPREEAYSTHQVRMELKGLGVYTPAIIAMLPHLLSTGADVPWIPLMFTLVAVLAIGTLAVLIPIWTAVRVSVREVLSTQ